MWSTNKKDSCLRSSLLTINCATCVTVVYIYLTYIGEQEKINTAISSKGVIQPEKFTSEKCTPVCNSRACVWQANMFLRNVNSTADPCENFSSFLCSGFQREFGSEEKGNVMSESRKPMMNKLKGILDYLQAEPGSALEKMKTVYDSCVNYGSSELQGISEFKNFLNDLGFLNWPHITQDFSFGDVNLPIILANFITFGAKPYIFASRVPGNETREDSLQVSFSRYMFNRSTEVPRELAVNMLKYFDLDTENIETIIKDHELVKSRIMDLYERTVENREEDTEVHIDCSRQNDDSWLDFCETFGVILNFISKHNPININSIIIEEKKDQFFKNLFPLLHSFSNRSLANFFALNLLTAYQADLNFYFRLSKLKHKDFEDESEIEGYEIDRWKYCVRWIANNMKLPLENEFFHQYLTNTVTEEIVNIYKNYSSEVINLITLQEWIPTEIKSKLEETLQNITFNIDLVSRILPNDTHVNKVYEKFIPSSESFFNNVLLLKSLAFTAQFSFKSLKKEDFAPYMTDFDVQATAGGPFLDIHFGMLLPPFYIPGHFSLINRVLLAPIIAHEFGHFIFGSLASQLEVDETFLEKQQCVADQFSRFKFENLNENLNGSKYAIENLPDNIGTTLIDKVIEKYSTEDIILPGLPYSTKQLLYMSASQIWCSKSNLEKDLHHKNVDYHAPTEFRLLGIMQNSRGHPEVFQCPEGSFMNPPTKCSLLDANRS